MGLCIREGYLAVCLAGCMNKEEEDSTEAIEYYAKSTVEIWFRCYIHEPFEL